MKSFTDIYDSLYLYTLFITEGVYICDGVSRLNYIFSKVSSLDEKLLGKTVLMSFLWKCK